MHASVLEALYFVAQKGWADSKTTYFDSLVAFLGKTLGLEYALVDELLPSGTAARTVGLYAKGAVVPNLEYDLAGTPCENVIGKRLCCYPRQIRARFPKDPLLVQMGAESYVGIPLWDSKGEAIGLIAVMGCSPLTDESRALAEAVLQVVALRCAHALESRRDESRLRDYRELLHSSIDGFWLLNTQGYLIEVNAAYAKMSGYTAAELLGKHLTDLDAVENPDQTKERIRKVLAEGHDRFETQHRKCDGSIFDVEVSALYWPGDGGRFAVIVRDLSYRKRAELEKAELEHRLQLAQKLEAVGRLAGGVAHDFNNMLGVILGYTNFALESPELPSTVRAEIQEIHRAAERSANLTRQLLAFARQQTVAPKVVRLNETIAGMLNMLQRLVGEDVELVLDASPDLWRVHMDPSQIDQVLANLCVNARDAIHGRGHVTIATSNWSATGAATNPLLGVPDRDFVTLTVTDDGCGMSRETCQHIFEPFYTTKVLGKGTGLGLATVYGVVTQNRGFIDVASEPGHGAKFTIYLPRYLGEEVVEPAVEKPMATIHRAETILVVEDEPALLRLTTMMLATLGYNVLSANHPGEAMELSARHEGPIALLLTDVVMPDINGRELDAWFRARHPGIKTLFMSGYTADVIASRGVLSDGVQFLEKPFTKRQLIEALQALGFAPRVSTPRRVSP